MKWLKKLLSGKGAGEQAQQVHHASFIPKVDTPLFTADIKVQVNAEIHAQEALRFTREMHQRDLDWSDASVAYIEAMLAQYHDSLPRMTPDDDKVQTFARMFGSYVGEVYRRNHGAVWGMISWQGEDMPGLQSCSNDSLLWPWMRAYKRIKNGPEENIWHYYQTLILNHNKSNSLRPFSIGQRVRHDRFGLGEILDYDASLATPCAWIKFEDGEIKMINLNIAKVEAVLVI